MNTKAHILYVEDDASLSFVTRDNLELQGYEISHCADGQTALNAIQTQDFDLCILDVMLPEVDGFTVAQEIRKKNTHVPILFLTARSLKEDRIYGLKTRRRWLHHQAIQHWRIDFENRNISASQPRRAAQ